MMEFSETELAELMRDMREAAKAEILPRFQALAEDAVRTKSSPDDLVTDADTGAERMLTAALSARFPEALIVGEEAVAGDPSLLGKLDGAALAFVIDPVDGTWNFANSMPLFGSMVAVIAGGMAVAGVIHYPVVGDYLVARKGTGAWHVDAHGTRRRLRVAEPRPLDRTSGIVPLGLMPREQQARIAPRLEMLGRITSYRCSAYEYRLLSQGSISFGLNATLMPWDHAAGQLIHTEAGGYSAVLPGIPYAPTMTHGQLLLAPDEESWHAIRITLDL